MRMRLAAAISLLACGAAAAAAQELDEKLLDRLKSASAFVIVKSGRGTSTGSAFLIQKRGDTGYLITCEHVVSGGSNPLIVFGSGLPGEKSYKGKVVAMDEDRDLACVVIKDAKDLPEPLEIGQKTSVRETETVYVAGFPFGKSIAEGDRNPEISIAKGTVSSIRREADGSPRRVQISGDINPGNSGGPVIDARGAVIGVAQSKVMGSMVAFGVPPEQVHAFLEGRLVGGDAKQLSSTATGVRLEVTKQIIDPLGSIKELGLAYCAEGAVQECEPGEDGQWGKMTADAATVPFKLDGETAVAEFDVARAESEPAKSLLLYQVFWTTAEGKTRYAEPVAVDLTFAEGEAKPDEPAPEPPTEEKVATLKKLPLQSAVSDLLLSPDGASLFALDLSENMVYRLDPETLEIVAKIDAVENASAMAMTPDGKTLYVGSRNQGHLYSETAGAVQAISTNPFQETASFRLEVGICDLEATDGGTLVASVAGQSKGLAVIDASKQAIAGVISRLHGAGFVRLHPNQARAYVGDTGLKRNDFHGVPLKERAQKYDSYPSSEKETLGGFDFQIAPDGRFLIACNGDVLRLSKLRQTDMRRYGKTAACASIAVAKGSNLIVAAGWDGSLRAYDLDSLKQTRDMKTGLLCTRLVLDPERNRVYALGSPVPKAGPYDQREPRIGDIVSFSLEKAEAAVEEAEPEEPAVEPSEEPAAVEPVKKIEAGAPKPRVVVSQDRKKAYLLVTRGASDSKVFIIDLAAFETEKEVALGGGETTLAVTPEGKTIAAAGNKKFSVVNMSDGKLRSEAIKFMVNDLLALDEERVLATTGRELVTLSIARQKVTPALEGGGQGRLHTVPWARRVYARSGVAIPPDEGAGRSEWSWSTMWKLPPAEYVVDPGGRYAVTRTGEVYRIGRSVAGDMVEMAKVEGNSTCVFLPSKSRMLLFTWSGQLKEYDTATFEEVRTGRVACTITEAFADETAGAMYAVGYRVTEKAAKGPPPCDFFKFELGEEGGLK